jgi:integrase
MARYKAPYRLVFQRDTNGKKKKGAVIYFRLGDDPHRTKHSTGCRIEADARKYIEDLIATKRKADGTMAFGDFTKDMFILDKCPILANKISDGRPVTKKLRRDYRAYLDNYLLPHFAMLPLDAITPAEIRRWRNSIMDCSFKPKSLRSGPPSHETMNKVRNTFLAIMKEARDEGYIATNPVAEVDPLPKSPKKRDTLTKEEIAILFPKDEEKLLRIWGNVEKAAMLYLVLTSGIRSGELRALKWQDVDWKAKGVRVTKAITAENELGPTKGRKPRGAIPPTRALELLKKWHDISAPQNPEAFIFPGRDGESHSSSGRLRSALKSALMRAKINLDGREHLVVHSLRHCFNTQMTLVLPPAALRGTIGHESEEMTEHYYHMTPDETIKELGKKFRRSIDKCWQS